MSKVPDGLKNVRTIQEVEAAYQRQNKTINRFTLSEHVPERSEQPVGTWLPQKTRHVRLRKLLKKLTNQMRWKKTASRNAAMPPSVGLKEADRGFFKKSLAAVASSQPKPQTTEDVADVFLQQLLGNSKLQTAINEKISIPLNMFDQYINGFTMVELGKNYNKEVVEESFSAMRMVESHQTIETKFPKFQYAAEVKALSDAKAMLLPVETSHGRMADIAVKIEDASASVEERAELSQLLHRQRADLIAVQKNLRGVLAHHVRGGKNPAMKFELVVLLKGMADRAAVHQQVCDNFLNRYSYALPSVHLGSTPRDGKTVHKISLVSGGGVETYDNITTPLAHKNEGETSNGHALNLTQTTLHRSDYQGGLAYQSADGFLLYKAQHHTAIQKQMGREVIAAAILSDPLQRDHIQRNGLMMNTPPLDGRVRGNRFLEVSFNAMNLVSSDRTEQAWLKDQQEILQQACNSGQPFFLPIETAAGKKYVAVKVNLRQFGFAINPAARPPSSNSVRHLSNGWFYANQQNDAALEALLGAKGADAMGGAVGQKIDHFVGRIKVLNEMRENASGFNARRFLEVEKNIRQISKRGDEIVQTASQVKEMWARGDMASNAGMRHQFTARVALLCSLIGETPLIGDENGDHVDRCDAEAKYLAAQLDASGTLPPSDEGDAAALSKRAAFTAGR